jgi:hypothetical protein
METVLNHDDHLVDDFFLPKGQQIQHFQENTPIKCYLCGKPSLASEEGVHAACAEKENLSDEY